MNIQKVYMMCLVQRISFAGIQCESMLCDTFRNSQINPDDGDDDDGMGNVQCVTLNTCIRPLKVH